MLLSRLKSMTTVAVVALSCLSAAHAADPSSDLSIVCAHGPLAVRPEARLEAALRAAAAILAVATCRSMRQPTFLALACPRLLHQV